MKFLRVKMCDPVLFYMLRACARRDPWWRHLMDLSTIEIPTRHSQRKHFKNRSTRLCPPWENARTISPRERLRPARKTFLIPAATTTGDVSSSSSSSPPSSFSPSACPYFSLSNPILVHFRVPRPPEPISSRARGSPTGKVTFAWVITDN